MFHNIFSKTISTSSKNQSFIAKRNNYIKKLIIHKTFKHISKFVLNKHNLFSNLNIGEKNQQKINKNKLHLLNSKFIVNNLKTSKKLTLNKNLFIVFKLKKNNIFITIYSYSKKYKLFLTLTYGKLKIFGNKQRRNKLALKYICKSINRYLQKLFKILKRRKIKINHIFVKFINIIYSKYLM